MPFGEWYCVVCQKTLTVGTVAPRSAMNRHLDSARHKKLAAEQKAAAKPADEQETIDDAEAREEMMTSGSDPDVVDDDTIRSGLATVLRQLRAAYALSWETRFAEILAEQVTTEQRDEVVRRFTTQRTQAKET